MQSNINEVQVGWNAYDRDGDKIGEVAEVGQDYVLVQKGLFFPKDLYIPMSFVTDVSSDDREVAIDVAKAEVENQGWDEPPTGDQAMATGGTASTSTTEVSGSTTTAGQYVTGSSDAYATGGTGSDADATGSTGTARTTDATSDTFTVPLREEHLGAAVREREAGDVRVGKHVVEEQQAIDVPVTHDEVEITRRQVDRPAGADDEIMDDGQTIRVPVRTEEVEVRKGARVVEEIEVSRRPVTESQRVSDTVRREEIDLEESGDVRVGGGEPIDRDASRRP